jgi:hypothetical protein
MTFLIIDGKDSANRVEKKQVYLIFYPEVPPMLSKDSANRVEKKQVCLIFYPEVPPVLFKDSANGRHRNKVLLKLCFESALILVK